MKTTLGALLLVVGPPASAAATAAVSNPLGKVIELLDGFAAKTTEEGEAADKAYRKFVEWCDDSASDKRFEIKTLVSETNKLEAKIDKLASEISVCDSKIAELVKALATADKDLQDATDIRKKEASEFAANEAELMDTVDTLKRAVSIVTKEMEKNPASFAQVDTSNFRAVTGALSALSDAASLGAAGKQKLMALVQANQESLSGSDSEQDPGAPAASVYSSHSGGLVDLLEDMMEKAEEDLAELRKAEMSSKQNYEMLKQSLEDTIKNGDKDMSDEKAAKSAAGEAKAQAEKDLAAATKELDDAQSALADIKSSCMQVAADHEASVASRSDELKAFAEAKKVLQETSAGAVEQTYSLLQVSEASRLRSRADLKRAEVFNMVKKLARRFHSSSLAQLASRIEAVFRLGGAVGADPFAKVKDMISSLITKLESEATAAAEEKAYCDDQMAKTGEKKGELEEDLAALTAKMDEAVASSAALKNDVKKLQKELAEIAKMQSELDGIRALQNSAYVKAKDELTLGISGVRRALGVLRDYFGSQEAAAMLQAGSSLEDAMKQPSKPVMHQKSAGAGGGVIGILEVCESDFTSALTKVEQEESDEAASYEKTTQENKVSMTIKSQAVSYKTQEFKSLDKALADMGSDKETMETELKAVLEYYSKVKDRCVAKPESYEERKARREAEIAGLKEALGIIESETALVQVRSGHRRQRALRN